MELTREEITDVANGKITPCELCDSMAEDPVREMAKMLITEMDKPKVWDGAPKMATEAVVQYNAVNDDGNICIARYHRELPKSPEREIAEKKAKEYLAYYGGMFDDKEARLVEKIQEAIKEALESVK